VVQQRMLALTAQLSKGIVLHSLPRRPTGGVAEGD